eukprot:3046192-Pyramimonas_sp.AAC.1
MPLGTFGSSVAPLVLAHHASARHAIHFPVPRLQRSEFSEPFAPRSGATRYPLARHRIAGAAAATR